MAHPGPSLRAVLSPSSAKVGRATPVGVFVEGDTPEGLSDLSGNVGEWIGSLFGKDPNRTEFAYPYDAGDGREDPEASSEIRRVVRGGAWYGDLVSARSAYRHDNQPGYRNCDIGFRLVAVSSPISS